MNKKIININNRTKAKKTHIHFLFLVILTYAYFDFRSSANIGLRGSDRGSVYIALYVLISFLALFYLASVFKKNVKQNNLSISMWIISAWIFFVDIVQGVDRWAMLVHLGLSILWIFAYHFGRYYITKTPSLRSSTVKWIVLVFIFYVYTAIYAVFSISQSSERIAVVNLSYYVMIFFPWISFIPKKRYRQILYALIFFVVLVSFKRGSIVIYPLMLMSYYLVKSKIEDKKITGFAKFILIAITFISGVLLVDYYSGGFLLDRFTLDSLKTGSGRMSLYIASLKHIGTRDMIPFSIGLGSGSSIQILGTAIHNEWLEFLFNFGLIGVITYAYFIISIIQKGIRYIKEKSKYSPAYATIVVYMVVIGLFSGLYFVHSTLYVMLFLGTIDGLVDKENSNEGISN